MLLCYGEGIMYYVCLSILIKNFQMQNSEVLFLNLIYLFVYTLYM